MLTAALNFDTRRSMEKIDAVEALAALAQANRLDVYRLLVQAGPNGLPAGQIAEKLKLAPNTLTFHLDRLRNARLVSARRDGRSIIYAARYDTMDGLLGFLSENCCDGRPALCGPAVRKSARKVARKKIA